MRSIADYQKAITRLTKRVQELEVEKLELQNTVVTKTQEAAALRTNLDAANEELKQLRKQKPIRETKDAT